MEWGWYVGAVSVLSIVQHWGKVQRYPSNWQGSHHLCPSHAKKRIWPTRTIFSKYFGNPLFAGVHFSCDVFHWCTFHWKIEHRYLSCISVLMTFYLRQGNAANLLTIYWAPYCLDKYFPKTFCEASSEKISCSHRYRK